MFNYSLFIITLGRHFSNAKCMLTLYAISWSHIGIYFWIFISCLFFCMFYSPILLIWTLSWTTLNTINNQGWKKDTVVPQCHCWPVIDRFCKKGNYCSELYLLWWPTGQWWIVSIQLSHRNCLHQIGLWPHLV